MKAKLKEGINHLFTPEFHTAINGQSARLSKDELVQNWTRYIYTPAAVLYENLNDLRALLKRTKGTVTEPVRLNMAEAKSRGKVFSQKSALIEFQKKQRTARAKLVRRHQAQQEREKQLAAKARKAGGDKARRDAKKAGSGGK